MESRKLAVGLVSGREMITGLLKFLPGSPGPKAFEQCQVNEKLYAPFDVIRRRRHSGRRSIEQAKKLIVQSGMTVNKVVEAVGCSNNVTFSGTSNSGAPRLSSLCHSSRTAPAGLC